MERCFHEESVEYGIFMFFLQLTQHVASIGTSPMPLKVTKNSQCCTIMYELMFTNLNYFKLHF